MFCRDMTAIWVVVVAGRLQKQAHGTEAYMYRHGVFHLTPWSSHSWDCAYARFDAPKPEKMELLPSGTGLSLRVLVELLLWSSRERHGIQAQANQSRSGFRTPIRLRLSRKGRSTLLRSSWGHERVLSTTPLRLALALRVHPGDQLGPSLYDLVRDTYHTPPVSSSSVKHHTRCFQDFHPSPKALADQE